MDAITLRLPVICSDNCCFAHYVKDFELGVSYKTSDENSLSDAIKRLYLDKAFYEKCVHNMEKFAMAKDVSQYSTNLRSILNELRKKNWFWIFDCFIPNSMHISSGDPRTTSTWNWVILWKLKMRERDNVDSCCAISPIKTCVFWAYSSAFSFFGFLQSLFFSFILDMDCGYSIWIRMDIWKGFLKSTA